MLARRLVSAPGRRTAMLTACGVALAITGAAAADRLAIPEPNLDRVDPAVRQQLTVQRALVDQLADQPAKAAELTAALGTLARLYLAYDLLQPAEPCLEALQQRDQGELRWSYLLGYLRQRQGRLEEAARALRRRISQPPESAAAQLRLGTVLLELGDAATARKHFERALAADPGCIAALHALGQLARRDGDLGDAVAHFRRALAADPDSPQVHYALGLTLRQQGLTDEATEHLDRVDFRKVSLGKWWGCPDPEVTGLADQATGSQVHLLRGAQAEFVGDLAVQLSEYRLAVEANPDDIDARKGYGSALYRNDDLEGAAEQYQAAVRLAPSDPVAQHDLGQVLLRLEKVDQAIVHLRAALAADATFGGAHLKLAQIFMERRQPAEAVPHLQAAAALDPLNLRARAQLSMAFLQLGRRQEAVDTLGRLLEEHPPTDPEEHLRLTLTLAALGDTSRAAAQLERLRKREGAAAVRAQASFRLAQLELAQGRHPAAIELLREAVELDPQLAPAHQLLEQLIAGGG